MISSDQAWELAAEWRPKFEAESDFEASWSKYFETATAPDVTRLADWLTRDLAKSRARQAGARRTGLDGVGRRLDYVHAELGVCPLCREHFEGVYLDHLGDKHKVRSEPDSAVNNLRLTNRLAKERYLAACQAAGVE